MKKNQSETVGAIVTLLIIAGILGAIMYVSSKRTDYIMEHCKPNFETQQCEFDIK